MSILEMQILVGVLLLLVGKMICLLVWIITKLYKLDRNFAVLAAVCPQFKKEDSGDTTRIIKLCKH